MYFTLGTPDFYISYKNEDGSWANAINMGEQVNTDAVDQAPGVTPDGKYLFFSYRRLNTSFMQESDRNDETESMSNQPGKGSSDIYWIDTSIIDEIKEGVFNH